MSIYTETKLVLPLCFGLCQLGIYALQIASQNPRLFGIFLNEKWKRGQPNPEGSWQVVVIYPNRKIAGEVPDDFTHFFSDSKVTQIYLDELNGSILKNPFIQALLLTTENDPKVFEEKVRKIVQNHQSLPKVERNRLLNFLRSLIIKAFNDITTKGIEKMLRFDTKWQDTAIYKEFSDEGRKEGSLETLRKNIKKIIELKFPKENQSEIINYIEKEKQVDKLEALFDECLNNDAFNEITLWKK